MKNLRIVALCFILACAAVVMAEDGTVEVRVYDTQGNLVTNATLTTLTEDGLAAKYFQRPDGVFEISAQVGDKLVMIVGTGTLHRGEISYTEIVPASETINLMSAAVDVPANDECDGATPVAVPSLTLGTTVGATADDAPFCGTSNGTGGGVWYSVVGTGGLMTATTCDAATDYDTKIRVYCADCDEKFCVAGDDDEPCPFSGLRSTVEWCSRAGVTYNILVHGFSTAEGNFGLAVSSGGACAPAAACTGAGACCTCLDEPFNCELADQDNCLDKGGIPRGEGTSCAPILGQPQAWVSTPGLPIDSLLPPAVDTINVPDSFTIGDVNIDLGITHTFVGDLDIVVSHGGASQNIWNSNCGSFDNINATADDSGSETDCLTIAGGPIDSVFFSPDDSGDGPLSVFNGLDAAGDWTISVTDNFGGDVGILNQWSVHIDGVGAPPCELNVTVCHEPDSNDPHTIVVGENSVPAHVGHGDTLGACETGDPESADGSFGNGN